MEKIDNKVIINGKWESISTKELNKGFKFVYDKKYNYKVVKNKLYSYIDRNDYSTLISDLDVSYIVKQDKMDVYFLSKDTLYKYNPYDGLKKLMKYNEWNFNYKNMIYIFD